MILADKTNMAQWEPVDEKGECVDRYGCSQAKCLMTESNGLTGTPRYRIAKGELQPRVRTFEMANATISTDIGDIFGVCAMPLNRSLEP